LLKDAVNTTEREMGTRWNGKII